MVKVSVITPSIRPSALKIVAESLAKQDFKDFEWLIGSLGKLRDEVEKEIGGIVPYKFVVEPLKREKDFYNLSKCWNALFRQAKGELIVNIVDGIWFPADTLTNFWEHFVANPKACITTVGNQYDETLSVLLWKDPRMRMDLGSFYEVNYPEMELCIASFPRQAVIDCKGLKEKWDEFAALGEKCMMMRINKIGYSLWIDQSMQYKSVHHDRIGGKEEWDKHYFEGCKYMEYCINQVSQEKELLGDL